MALGYTTYKTSNAINMIYQNLSGREGSGVSLVSQGTVAIADSTAAIPYGVVVVGGESNDGTYPGPIGGSAVEFVDQLGCVVQVKISGSTAVVAGDFLLIDSNYTDGTFTGTQSQAPVVGDWLWGIALTNANSDEQCVMRFQPQYFFSTYTP